MRHLLPFHFAFLTSFSQVPDVQSSKPTPLLSSNRSSPTLLQQAQRKQSTEER